MQILLVVAFIVLLVVFPRQTLAIAGSAVALALLVMLYVIVKERSEDRERSLVSVQLIYDTKSCSQDYPVRALISNGSSHVVEKVEWQVAAFLPGHSTNLAEPVYPRWSTDTILTPSQYIALCFTAPKLNGAKISDVTLASESVWPSFRDN